MRIMRCIPVNELGLWEPGVTRIYMEKTCLQCLLNGTDGIYSCNAQEIFDAFACKFPNRFKVYYVLSQVSVMSSSFINILHPTHWWLNKGSPR